MKGVDGYSYGYPKGGVARMAAARQAAWARMQWGGVEAAQVFHLIFLKVTCRYSDVAASPQWPAHRHVSLALMLRSY
jgi:hypothetical protein